MRAIWLSLLFPLIGSSSEPSLAYTDTNSVQARRNLEKILLGNPASLSEVEGVEWVRARFALVALLRLQGNEKEALKVFRLCDVYCERWGPPTEWVALRRWGCGQAKDAEFCRKK